MCEGVWACTPGGEVLADDAAMTPGVVTEWYRAPEVFLIPHAAKVAYYSTALDTWSFGCIVYELLGSRPMAQGRGAAEVCACWLSVIGSPLLAAAARATCRGRMRRPSSSRPCAFQFADHLCLAMGHGPW